MSSEVHTDLALLLGFTTLIILAVSAIALLVIPFLVSETLPFW
jgi:hypothetical protein